MALSADTTVLTRGNWVTVAFPVAASTTIYKGALVCENTAGYAVPAADTASYRFLGIAEEKKDNASGSAGDLTVKVSMPAGGAQAKLTCVGAAQTDVGEVAYVTDDASAGTPGTDPGNTVVLGRAVEFVSSTSMWIALQEFSVNA